MKKFAWRLERLLQIRLKQEDIARADLARVIDQIKVVKDDLRRRRENRRNMLESFAATAPQQRIERQQSFLASMRFLDEAIDKTAAALAELEQKRKEKTAAYLELRRARKSLERMRQRAVEEYTAEYKKFEQQQFDEAAGISLAREIFETQLQSV